MKEFIVDRDFSLEGTVLDLVGATPILKLNPSKWSSK